MKGKWKGLLSSLAVLLFLTTCGKIPEAPVASAQQEALRIAVFSDLHFTVRAPAVAIYPLAARCQDFTDTLADELIARKPDAVILCGDNTASGRDDDERALCAILRRIRDSGIPVIAVPGNHDYDAGSPEQFLGNYASLCVREAEDENSLSFRTHVGALCVLAMDDSAQNRNAVGVLPEPTMRWLEGELQNAAKNAEQVIFVSHHNVLPGGSNAEKNQYSIQNASLLPLLQRYDVRLCLSGHRHSQTIQAEGALFEIISGMPIAAPHLYGMLSLAGETLRYKAQSIDFARYGAPHGLADLEEYEAGQGVAFPNSLTQKSAWLRSDAKTRKRIRELFDRFMTYYAAGRIAEIQEELVSDPDYPALLSVLEGSNYGPWIEATLNADNLPGNRLEMEFPPLGQPDGGRHGG